MIRLLNALLEACRKSVMASTRNTPMPPQTAEGSLQDLILGACSDNDATRMHTLLDEWHKMIFQQAAKSGSVEVLQQLLHRYGTTAVLNQLMLEQAAQHGNAPVFSLLLQQQPEPVINDKVRSNALEGGVDIWKVILDHKPELINYDFGEIGDPLAMAALMNNVPLLRFFLEKGLDPNNSRILIAPIIDFASKTPSIKPEILDLLLQYGATKEKSLAATNKWRSI
ncbi:MAG: hypothetical protein L6R35_005505 [Caloplaca aegaea]|nr:MAG: hypothetical protein L6R35_005505 [Caloplaca aegaea]